MLVVCDLSRAHENKNEMSVKYWDQYYLRNRRQQPSDYARSLDLSKRNVLDLGCGDGRDTYYFAQSNSAFGIDQATKNTEITKRIDVIKYLSEIEKADVVYMRFFLHAVPESLEDVVLEWVSKNARECFIECRSDKGEAPDSTHYRRLINSASLLAKCEKLQFTIVGFEESQGLAVKGSENPWIIRLHLKTTSHS